MPKSYIVDDEIDMRLDVFVAQKLQDLSRASIQKFIKKGLITVNGEAQKTGYTLKHSDKVRIDQEITEEKKIDDIELPIIYEDDDCLVINKPAGVLTHSKGAFNPEPTVATFIQQHSKKVDGDRSGIVHRLDRATSGVMICAKTPEALVWLQKQFSQRKVKKKYLAIVKGILDPSEAIIDMPIERNPQKPQTFRVGSNGKQAVTYYCVIETGNKYSLVELKPETGRTHQLRVHLLNQHHPIVGDVLYDGEAADRLYLHAAQLEITLPNRERKVFSVDMPSEFTAKISE